MKNFYKKILIFLIPCLMVWIATEYFYRSTENNYNYKHSNLIEQYQEIEILALGNSHSLYGVNPVYFKRPTFNLANISQSLYFDELLLAKHIDSLSNLKAILLNISYFSLSQEDNSSEDAWRKYFYQEQMKLEVPIISKFDIKGYSLALARRFNKSVDLFDEFHNENTILGCDQTGYGLQDASDITPDKDIIAPIIAKKHEDGSINFETGVERLEKIIAHCKGRDIQVFLVEMPVYKAYYELLNAEKKEKVSRTCRELSVKNSNVHHLKLSQYESFQDSDLRDADHLTNEGAKKCSELLSEIIEEQLSY